MLNYKNDSLLLEKETANDIIRNKKEKLIFINNSQKILNLFSALVKKEDFVKTNKKTQPMQRSAYAKLSEEAVSFINKKHKDKSKLIKLLEIYTERRLVLTNGPD